MTLEVRHTSKANKRGTKAQPNKAINRCKRQGGIARLQKHRKISCGKLPHRNKRSTFGQKEQVRRVLSTHYRISAPRTKERRFFFCIVINCHQAWL